jgi:hypothetical protein
MSNTRAKTNSFWHNQLIKLTQSVSSQATAKMDILQAKVLEAYYEAEASAKKLKLVKQFEQNPNSRMNSMPQVKKYTLKKNKRR